MKFIITIIIFSVSFFSCTTLDKSRMLKTPTNYEFKTFVDSVNYKESYKIAIDDQIQIQMFSNNGYNMINIGGIRGGGNSGANGRNGNQNSYKVRSDSTIKVPIIGQVKVVGLNLIEIEIKFEKLLETHVNSPFVIATISNRRIFLFQGGYSATVFQLQNENTTLFEVLANSGGIYNEGNASRIKIIRGDLEDPDIYLIDLSTIDGMKNANLNMLAGDIVYIDPFINYPARISSDIGSIMGFLTSILLVYTITQQ